jgi:hypothetical protein
MPCIANIYNANIHPSRIVVWKENIYDKPYIKRSGQSFTPSPYSDTDISESSSSTESNSLINLRRNTYKQKMSKSSISKCKRSIDYLLLNATNKTNSAIINWRDVKFRMAFITLTLPSAQIHTDNQIKRDCLNPFLINAKRLFDIQHYVWRSEKQVNGNVHFHILIDKFVPWHEVRGLWNRLISKLGYIDSYRNNMQSWHSNGFKVRKELLSTWSYSNQLKAYSKGKKDNWSNPNSTDIHSVRFINNVGAYITKYMTKNEKLRKFQLKSKSINYTKKFVKGTHSLSFNTMRFLSNQSGIGRLWGCSLELTSLKGGECILDDTISSELNTLENLETCKIYEDSWYKVYNISIESAIKAHCFNIVTLLSEYMTKRFVLKDTS